jgi:hypothetical protein
MGRNAEVLKLVCGALLLAGVSQVRDKSNPYVEGTRLYYVEY